MHSAVHESDAWLVLGFKQQRVLQRGRRAAFLLYTHLGKKDFQSDLLQINRRSPPSEASEFYSFSRATSPEIIRLNMHVM